MRLRGLFAPMLTSLLFCLAALLSFPTLSEAKEIFIEWKPIEGAVQYDLEIQDGEKPILKKLLDDTTWKGSLKPGFYEYRLRAVDKIERPGQWSSMHTLVVLPIPPEPGFPKDGGKVATYRAGGGFKLKWDNAGTSVHKYQVEVKRGERIVYQGTTSDTELFVKGLRPGNYSWNVRSVVEASGRVPASMQGKKWESAPSEDTEFTVERKKLDAPVIVSPTLPMYPPSNGKLKFQWKELDGAESYEVIINKDGQAGKRYITQKPDLVAITSGEGEYTWRVRGLASVDTPSNKGVIGPQSTANFRLDRGVLFVEGSGYVALSTMLAPYDYKVVSPLANRLATVSSDAVTIRGSGEYWFKTNWAFAGALETTQFTINGANYNRGAFELMGKYRKSFSNRRYGWSFAPKLGIEGREYFEVPLTPTSPSSKFMTLGPSIGLDVRRQFNEQWSLGAKLGYFYPIAGAPTGSKFTSEASYRNFSVGLQGLYWFGGSWALGAGAYVEKRSISFQPTTTKAPEQIYMDAVYFFGSLIYSFGR